MSTDDAFDAKMKEIDRRLDASTVRLDKIGRRSSAAMDRLDDTLAGVIERVELLGVSFDGVYASLVEHIRKRHHN